MFRVAELLPLFLFALAGSLALTPVCRYIAKRAGYVAAPTVPPADDRPSDPPIHLSDQEEAWREVEEPLEMLRLVG